MLPILVELQPADLAKGSVTGAALVDGDKTSVDELVEAIKQAPVAVYVQAKNLSADDAVRLFNAGAHCVVVSDPKELLDAGITADRIVVSTTAQKAVELVAKGQYAGVMVPASEDAQAIAALVAKAGDATSTGSVLVDVFVSNAEKLDKVIRGAIPVIADTLVTSDPEANPGKISLAGLIAGQAVSDRADGLFLTVVVNENGRTLGTCFSSAESIKEAVRTGTGVYQSRRRGLWYKGASSGATQKLCSISLDCDGDAFLFTVQQTGVGFCHNNTLSCFGAARGLEKLESTVKQRLASAPVGSYTHRLFTEKNLLPAKIMEEARELAEAQTASEVAFEAADLLYFATVKLAQAGISWRDVEDNLDTKSRKVTRRKGDAKPWAAAAAAGTAAPQDKTAPQDKDSQAVPAAKEQATAKEQAAESDKVAMTVIPGSDKTAVAAALRRPAQSSNAFDLAKPIVEDVRKRGDAALLSLTEKFDKVKLATPVLKAPFPQEMMNVSKELKDAIDLACANVEKFHSAQLSKPMSVETSPGVVCSRFARPIARVGLYVPGGSAVLPSTAIMLGVPAKVAGCKEIVFASPPARDGSLTPEVVYVAHKVGASQIVLAGGAQAVAAMAYGTDSVTKCDKILGPGNQFVTAAKMIVQTDLEAQVSIDMPAGPSEVLVVADKAANKAFVVSDLLSQAEHGPDSQVILIAIDWTDKDLEDLQAELDKQARALPRFEIIKKAIAHSSVLLVSSRDEALTLSNLYAPEHLILQVENASSLLPQVDNAGSVFVGALSPESCGDYTSGTNHTLPTYGYANQYSGVNTSTFQKHITAQELTPEGIASIGPATFALATREGLDGHANAIKIRMDAFST